MKPKPPLSAPWLADDAGTPINAPQRYVPGGELGRGGMGVVTSEFDVLLDRDVAVKRFRPELLGRTHDELMREARLTARLVHPSIVPIYDAGTDANGSPFYTMPVMVGQTLFDVIRGDALSIAARVRVVVAACQAVGFAHVKGVLHRDVKPSNILVGAFGEVWVLDWGVAFDPNAPDDTPPGTPAYASPEQTRGDALTPAADVYSLGRTLRAVLCTDPDGALDAVSDELSAIVERACAPEPENRYANGVALATDLTRWLDGQMVDAHNYSTLQMARRLVWAWRAPLVVGAAASAVIVALGGWTLKTTSQERDLAVQAQAEASDSLAETQVATASLYARGATVALGADDWVSAEFQAALSVELNDSSIARGVLMGVAAPVPTLDERYAVSGCDRVSPSDDGQRYLCIRNGVVDVRSVTGEVDWTIDTGLDGGLEAEFWGDGVLVRLEPPSALSFWTRTGRLWTAEVERGAIHLERSALSASSTQIIARTDSNVVLVDPSTGAATVSALECDSVHSIVQNHLGLLVGCTAGVYIDPMAGKTSLGFDVGSVSSLEASPTGAYVGTWEGRVYRWDGQRVHKVLELDVPVVGMRALPDDRLAIFDEQGGVSLWDGQGGTALARLAGTAMDVRPVADGVLRFFGDDIRDFRTPEQLTPRVFDATEFGGISWMRVSPDGAWVAVGHATGDADLWELSSGRRTFSPKTEGRNSRSGTWTPDSSSVVIGQLNVVPERRVARETGETTWLEASTGTHQEFVDDVERVKLAWGSDVFLARGRLDDDGPQMSLTGRGVDMVQDNGSVYVLDVSGELSQVLWDGFALSRTVVRSGVTPGHLAKDGDVFVTGAAHTVSRYSVVHGLEWEQPLHAQVTAVAVDSAYVFVGLMTGELVVLHPDGTEVARVQGHRRRVSDIGLVDGAVLTSSWDGLVRRWNLEALSRAPSEFLPLARQRHGITEDDLNR